MAALSSHLTPACPQCVPELPLESHAPLGTGPAQLLMILTFDQSDFRRKIIAQLKRLHDEETVHVIDAIAVYKDADAEMELQRLTHLGTEPAVEAETTIGAVIGLRREGEKGAVVAPDHPAFPAVETSWDVLEELPTDSATALVLLQHHWTVCLKDLIADVDLFDASDGFIISPLDLGEIRASASPFWGDAGRPKARN
jgi:hypothetical protein